MSAPSASSSFDDVARPVEARNRDVVRLARVAGDVPAEILLGAVEPAGEAALVAGGVAAQFEAARHRFAFASRRDAAVDGIDDATDRAAAEQQRRRPLEHFDLVGEQRLDRDRVVRAQVRHVERAGAVEQHQHPLAGQAANDRAAGLGAEIARSHAELRGERLAEAAADVAGEIVAGQDHGGLREVHGARTQGARGYDDFFEIGVLGQRRGNGQHGQGRGQGQRTTDRGIHHANSRKRSGPIRLDRRDGRAAGAPGFRPGGREVRAIDAGCGWPCRAGWRFRPRSPLRPATRRAGQRR